MYKKTRYIAVVLIALILTASIYAFAAANSMPDGSSAGDGNAPISGFTVSNVTYTLSADPSTIASVKFTLAPSANGLDAKSASIQLTTGGTWFTCTISSGVATCPISGSVTTLAANNLRVVAAQ